MNINIFNLDVKLYIKYNPHLFKQVIEFNILSYQPKSQFINFEIEHFKKKLKFAIKYQ